MFIYIHTSCSNSFILREFLSFDWIQSNGTRSRAAHKKARDHRGLSCLGLLFIQQALVQMFVCQMLPVLLF